jgi:Flp pilus assembly protein protease CpaA
MLVCKAIRKSFGLSSRHKFCFANSGMVSRSKLLLHTFYATPLALGLLKVLNLKYDAVEVQIINFRNCTLTLIQKKKSLPFPEAAACNHSEVLTFSLCSYRKEQKDLGTF